MEEKLRMTIVVPCFNEQESIRLFHDEVERTFSSGPLSELDHNILFVNDGSSDDTLLIIKQLARNSDNIEYVSLSRNFGKEAAIFAGLENSTGDFVALMDADLQDPPNLLEKMFLTIVNEGFDCVATKRSSRKGEPLIRSWFAMFFYKIINSISKINLVDGARDFRLMTRQMVDSIVSLREYNRFSKGLFSWVGFNVKWIEYENIERIAGKTKWSFWGLFLYSVDGIIAFSAVPLALSSFLGVLISFFSLLGIIFIVVKTVIFGDPVTGWPSLVTIVSFIGGLQLLCLGIIGQYLAKTYMETKDRPIYILKETSLKK